MRRTAIILVGLALVAAACSSSSGDEPDSALETVATAEPTAEPTAGATTSSANADEPEAEDEAAAAAETPATLVPADEASDDAVPLVVPGDPTLELDRGSDAPAVAADVPTVIPDEPIGTIGFSRYVYVASAGTVIPSLVEGPIAEQIRCQQVALPCSYQDLKALQESGDPIPEQLGLNELELELLVGELGEVQQAIGEFPDADAACAAGFRPDRSQSPNMGSHFTSMDRVLDARFDPSEPEIIMMARVDGQAPDGPLGRCQGTTWDGVDVEPVGVAFFQPFAFVGDDHFRGFAGDLDNWHVHYNLCRLDGADLTVPPSVCEGQGGNVGEFTPEQLGTSPQGEASEGWMIHAWADPEHDNQLGAFSMWNPTLWPTADASGQNLEFGDAGNGNVEVIDDFTLPDIAIDEPGKVTFFNTDDVAHTATAGSADEPGEQFDTGLIGNQTVAQVAFDEPGTFPYFCSLHPDMQGTITVGSG